MWGGGLRRGGWGDRFIILDRNDSYIDVEIMCIVTNAILSIKPKFVMEIASGRKCFEYRKRCFSRPVRKVYVYSSAPISRVVGEFVIGSILEGSPESIWEKTKEFSGTSREWYDLYFSDRHIGYAIEIKDFVLYEHPLRLRAGFRAPQSYCYVDTIDED